jgi:hypothetical protein
MRIGNTSFNVESLGAITKEQFIERYKGKINVDINEAAKQLEKHFRVEVEFVQVDLEDSIDEVLSESKPKKKRRRK